MPSFGFLAFSIEQLHFNHRLTLRDLQPICVNCFCSIEHFAYFSRRNGFEGEKSEEIEVSISDRTEILHIESELC